jgi:hypothetical protein
VATIESVEVEILVRPSPINPVTAMIVEPSGLIAMWRTDGSEIDAIVA